MQHGELPNSPKQEYAKITSKHVENINSTNNQRIANNTVRILFLPLCWQIFCCYFHYNFQYCHKHRETTAPHHSRDTVHLERMEWQFWEIVSALWKEEYNSGNYFGMIAIKPLKFIPFYLAVLLLGNYPMLKNQMCIKVSTYKEYYCSIIYNR